jgi:hypothetical protein
VYAGNNSLLASPHPTCYVRESTAIKEVDGEYLLLAIAPSLAVIAQWNTVVCDTMSHLPASRFGFWLVGWEKYRVLSKFYQWLSFINNLYSEIPASEAYSTTTIARYVAVLVKRGYYPFAILGEA